MEGSAASQTAQLAVEGLSVRFEGLAALSEVSLAVQRHEVFGLIGLLVTVCIVIRLLPDGFSGWVMRRRA